MWLKDNDGWNLLGGGLGKDEENFLISLAKEVARPGMIGFDTGCFTGWTASCVWPIFKQNSGHFYCVDWFKGNVDTVVGGFWWGNYPAETVLLQLLKNIETRDALDAVSVVVAESWRLTEIIADSSVDYVYVGGDHRYTQVKKDISLWLPKIRPGGAICGHAFDKDVDMNSPQWQQFCDEPEQDYYGSAGTHFGVVRAVNELLPGHIHGGQIWAYRKPL